MSGPRPGHLDAAIATLRETTALSDERLAALFESAFVDTYRRLVDDDGGVHARVDLFTGRCTMYRRGPDGEEVAVDVGVPDFPRQAAQAARAAVATALREAGKDRVLREASLRRGELIDTIVDTHAGPVWYLRAGDMRVLLPPEEQAQGEELVPGQPPQGDGARGTAPQPRRRRGGVPVPPPAAPTPPRAGGSRGGQRPGAGPRHRARGGPAQQGGGRGRRPGRRRPWRLHRPAGVRHQAITSVLGEEQVQIVVWSDDPATYIANALAPATVRGVDLDQASRTARVTVESDQLSLAIGRGGDNARLVARLCGWRIDVVAPE